MLCSHDNPPGYAFCAVCGQTLVVQRCSCGFVCHATDHYCGRCGAALDKKHTAVEGESRIRQNGQYDLNILREAADRRKSTLGGPRTKVNQNDIRRMLDAMKKAGQ